MNNLLDWMGLVVIFLLVIFIFRDIKAKKYIFN